MTVTRRTFTYRSVAAIVAASSVGKAHFSQMPAPPSEDTIDLSHDWDFLSDDKILHKEVTLPHCVNALSWADWRPEAWQKVWTYRKQVQINELVSDRRVLFQCQRAMASSRLFVNGNQVGTHRGGFTPFVFEITSLLRKGTNEILLEVDSRWANVPPSGSPRGPDAVDYYLPGGLIGNAKLVLIPTTAIDDIWYQAKNVVSGRPTLDVLCTVKAHTTQHAKFVVKLFDDQRIVRSRSVEQEIAPGENEFKWSLNSLQGIELWDCDHPKLYRVQVDLWISGKAIHSKTVRVGFREARFETNGFYLNGNRLQLFGLNRHELFPFVGYAASDRAMRHDATYLRRELNCNVVRCSHYPQSEAFLDACDEVGLMVWEEIPGWQYLGDDEWKDVAMKNVEEMIRRDRSHPSIIIWGTRVNESKNDPTLYTRTRDIAKKLDPSRPTSGSMTPSSRADWKEHWHEDVFAFDDYHAATDGTVGIESATAGVPYMLAEAVGQYSYGVAAKNFLRRYRRAGNPAEQNAQAVLHAQAHDRAASDPNNSGVIAWCGFDYASPMNAYHGVKCPGVVDTFRIPKLGSSFYLSQIDPRKRPVLEPSFAWDSLLQAQSGKAFIFSNCDKLQVFLGESQFATLSPDRSNFPNLKYPPFVVDLPWQAVQSSSLRIEGFLNNKKVISRTFSSSRKGDRLWVKADDLSIDADGRDSTRIAFGIEDKHGNPRYIAEGKATIRTTGPCIVIGDLEFDLHETGAVGAVWIKSRVGQKGTVRIIVEQSNLGISSAEVLVV